MVSCSSNENPEKHSRAELVGSWDRSKPAPSGWQMIYVANDGDILRGFHDRNCYIGKVDETFDYPYTVKLTVTNIKAGGKSYHGGTITFYNATNCDINYTKEYYSYKQEWQNINTTNNHNKISSEFIDYHNKKYTKEEAWKHVYSL